MEKPHISESSFRQYSTMSPFGQVFTDESPIGTRKELPAIREVHLIALYCYQGNRKKEISPLSSREVETSR